MPEPKAVNPRAVLLVYCPDKKGIAATVADFIYKHNGNIVDIDQFVDPYVNIFFLRVEWELQGFTIDRDDIGSVFSNEVGHRFDISFRLYFTDIIPRMAVFVSKLNHCFYDLMGNLQSGDWDVEAPVVFSNHLALADDAKRFGMDFHHFPVTRDNKVEQMEKQMELLRDYRIDFVVLARYMQILPPGFVEAYPSRIINIHHSFLPAFAGAKPYHSAYNRGVKIIGATSHYVTEQLDEGPIIEQEVKRVSHKDAVKDLIWKGRDLEKIVLSRAVHLHILRRILVYGNRTIVFT